MIGMSVLTSLDVIKSIQSVALTRFVTTNNLLDEYVSLPLLALNAYF